MYSVLIADDEDIIRRGLARFVESEGDFRVVAQAEDGQMALEAAQSVMPDLLLIDINMPFFNGLSLTEQLLSCQPDAVIVIITGYDDFEFVQKALRLGVFDYILKPVMERDFFSLLSRVKEYLKEKHSNRKYLDWARDQLERCRPSIVENFLNKWVYGQLDEVEFRERLRYLALSLPEKYAVAVIKLKSRFDQNSSIKEVDWDDNLMYFACQNIVQELYMEESETICFRNMMGNLIVISDWISPVRWTALREKINGTVERCLNVEMLIAHTEGQGIMTIPEAVDSAVKQLESKQQYSDIVTKTLQYMEKEMSNRELSLQDIATALFISPQHLSRIFKQETGDTFGAYLSQMRVRKATVLLRDPKLKMYEVAERTGYSSQHYFSSAFKKVLGISPVEYRKSILGRGKSGG